NSQSKISGISGNSLNNQFCQTKEKVFGENESFHKHGGLKKMGEALQKGMVLVMSLWDDTSVDMLWLDSTYPKDSTKTGAKRGPCSTDSGKPNDVENKYPDANVIYSNIRVGPINSTFHA